MTLNGGTHRYTLVVSCRLGCSRYSIIGSFLYFRHWQIHVIITRFGYSRFSGVGKSHCWYRRPELAGVIQLCFGHPRYLNVSLALNIFIIFTVRLDRKTIAGSPFQFLVPKGLAETVKMSYSV